MVHDDKPELLFYKTFNMLNKDPQEGWIVDPSKLGSSKDASEKTNISVSTTTKDDSSPIIDTEVEKPPSSLMFDKLRAMIPKNVEVKSTTSLASSERISMIPQSSLMAATMNSKIPSRIPSRTDFSSKLKRPSSFSSNTKEK